MTVSRDDVHRLVDAVPAEALPEVDAYLRAYAEPIGRSLERRLADAGLLEEPEPLTKPVPDIERLTEARRHAGQGKPLSEFVSENR